MCIIGSSRIYIQMKMKLVLGVCYICVSVKTGFLCSLLENALASYATVQLARLNLV